MGEHFISREDAERDLLACATYLAESIESADGHAEGISAVVQRYLAKGEVDLAAELANTVDDPFTRDRLLIHVAESCALNDDDEYATQLVEAIEEPALQAEGRERIGMLEASRGKVDAARKIAGEMEHPDFVRSAIAIKEYADGDTDAFRTTLGGIEFPGARVSAYTSIAHTELEAGNTDGITELLNAAAADAAEIEHDEERLRALIEIGTLFIEANQNGRAIETFDTAREYAEQLDNIHRDAFLAAVSVGFLRAGSQELADRSLDLVADKTQIATCLLGHARYYWFNDSRDDALESLEEAHAILKSQREIETRSSRERFKLFGSLAAQFALFDKGERAIETAEAIEDDSESIAALAQVAVILAAQDRDELARRALNAIPDDAERASALIGTADAFEKKGEVERAKESLDEAFVMSSAIRQPASRGSAYLTLAKRYAKLGEPEKFFSSLAQAFEAISSLKDESIQVASLVELDIMAEELKMDVVAEAPDFLKTILRDVPQD